VNRLATVAFEHWKDRWPRGGLVALHAPVGTVEVERRLLTETYAGPGGPPIADAPVAFPATLTTHKSVPWTRAFNIDPAGTEDVDDIFAWRRVDARTTQFMIAIADVAAWVPPDCDVDTRARALGQTLYDDGAVVVPMLPTSLSTRTASLRCDEIERPVLGLVFTLVDECVAGQAWEEHLVALTDAFTYETVEEDMAIQLYDYLCETCIRRPDPGDTHDWVACAMITYNYEAAKLLHDVGLGVLRRHSGLGTSDYAEVARVSGCDAVKSLGASAGEYVIGSSLQTEHAGLDLPVYCHATSPLRRYSDLVNQRMLKYLLFGASWLLGRSPVPATGIVADLNLRAGRAKAYERDFLYLRVIRPAEITRVSGIVLKAKEGVQGAWSVYVPAWKRTVRAVSPPEREVSPGATVGVDVYCDLRRPAWKERIVCTII
jgi:exoribonuclease R